MGVAAGATNVNTVFPVIQQYAGGGGFLSALNGLNFLPSLGPTATTRIVNTQTTNNASTAFVRAGIQINYNSGVAVDITLLIGWPQLELGAFATSPIRTTNAAATRAADKATLTNPSTVTNVQTLGAQFVSLTNNGTPAILDVSDGTANNRNTLLVNSASGQNASGASVISAGAQNPRLDGSGPYIVNTLVKAAYASQPGQRAFASNGGVVSSSINMGTLTGLTTISIGTFGAGVAGFANAYIRRIMLWPTTYLSNISLQRLTL
jgi:hypothetical protein